LVNLNTGNIVGIKAVLKGGIAFADNFRGTLAIPFKIANMGPGSGQNGLPGQYFGMGVKPGIEWVFAEGAKAVIYDEVSFINPAIQNVLQLDFVYSF
jgi:hypothetical protein